MDQISFVHVLEGLLILAIALSVYYVPTVVAKQRRHNDTLAIFVLNSLPLILFVVFFLASLLALGSIVPSPLVPIHAFWTSIGAATIGAAVSIGWTVISWSVALVWSCTKDVREDVVLIREPSFKREPA